MAAPAEDEAGGAPPPPAAAPGAAAAAADELDDVQSLRKAIELVNTLTQELDIEAAMESVRHVALSLLACERVTLFLVNEARQELRAKLGPHETGEGAPAFIVVRFGEGIAGTVAQQGGLMNIADAYSHPLFNPDIDRLTRYHTRNILCSAIRDTRGKIVAVVQALNKLGGSGSSFTPADEQHIRLFGVHLGNTLAKSRFFEEAKREKERLTTLRDCFKRLNAVTSLTGALDTVALAVKELVWAEHVCMLLMDHARHVLWCSITTEHTRGAPRLFRVQRDDGLIGRCAADKQQVALCFPAATPQQQQDGTLRALYAVLSGRPSGLSEVLLQPVCDGATGAVSAVVCALNRCPPGGRDSLVHDPSFSASDTHALEVFSHEIADVLGARAVDVSFASALCTVSAAASGSGELSIDPALLLQQQQLRSGSGGGGGTAGADGGGSGTSSTSGAGAAGAGSGGGGSPSPQGGQQQLVGAPSRSQQALNSMLTAHLLAYAPASLAGCASAEVQLHQHHSHHPAALQHSHTFTAASLLCRSDSSSARALSGSLASSGGGEGAAEGALAEAPCRLGSVSSFNARNGGLRRFSSTSAASRAASCASGGPASPTRSFHHVVPALPGIAEAGAARRAELASWELDCGSLGREELVRLAYDIFSLSGLLTVLGVPERELSGFLSAVAGHYNLVPYHNLGHAVQVLHSVWLILETTSARSLLSPEEELVLLVACVCHDLDHDGLTNSFHIHSGSPLAQRYNDRSVQENHHCALTFALLAKPGANLLAPFAGSREEYAAARSLLIDLILATDMQDHFALVSELLGHGLSFAPDDDADRRLLLKALLHAADVGNHIRPWPLALANAQRLHAEFSRQVAREQAAGLPVSPHMACSHDVAAWAQMEVNFCEYIAGPLWERMAQIFPELQEPLSNMRSNRDRFAELAAKGAAASPPDQQQQQQDGAPATSTSSISSSQTAVDAA